MRGRKSDGEDSSAGDEINTHEICDLIREHKILWPACNAFNIWGRAGFIYTFINIYIYT